MRRSFEECRDAFMAARQSGNWADLVYWATELIQYHDNLPWVWAIRGGALAKLGHPVDAILNYDKALEFERGITAKALLYSNKGSAYWDMFENDKALVNLNKALTLHKYPETYMTLGHIYRYNGELDKAIEKYRQAVEITPDHADSHLSLGMTLLKAGQLEEGWKEYEWRWKSDQLPPRSFKYPHWKGEPLNNKSILVYEEQGLGDILQFCRYVRVLATKYPTAKIIVEGKPVVQRLLMTLQGAHKVINIGEDIPQVDYVIPMVSLAGILTPTKADIPASTNEFVIAQQDVIRWKRNFDKANIPGKRIGLCWAGMSRTTQPHAAAVDALRSMELASMAPLAAVPGIFWISLQKGPPADQIKTPPRGMTIGDFTDEMHDFYETCAAISNLDLVITVDTAVAHAAASIGKPTWMFSRWDGCWRWFGDGLRNPWYPSMLQFAQHKPRDWKDVVNVVARELADLVRKQ